MSSQAVIDYLTKQVFIEKNIVTYRSLSRDLRIHVNDAKKELAKYFDIAPYQGQVLHATYLICGEARDLSKHILKDVILSEAEDEDECEEEGELVPQRTFVLVNETDLQNAQSRFRRGYSVHVYSLSPSPIHDAGLLCTPTEAIRVKDFGNDSTEMASVVGKIVSSVVKLSILEKMKPCGIQDVTSEKKPPKVKRNAKEPVVRQPVKIVEESSSKFSEQNMKEKSSKSIIAKQTEDKGKAKFFFQRKEGSKQGSGSESVTDIKAVKGELKPTLHARKIIEIGNMESDSRDDESGEPGLKFGVKRKRSTPSADSLHDCRSSTPSTLMTEQNKVVRVKKNVVISDEEETPAPESRFRRAVCYTSPDKHCDARALMDVDDDQVTRVIRVDNVASLKEEEEESAPEDTEAVSKQEEMDGVSVSVAKPRKRRPKKVVPIGKNGLKKRRVIKSRKTTDAKGYTIVEDYSSYESVDEEEKPDLPDLKSKPKNQSSNADNVDSIKLASKGGTAVKKTSSKKVTKTVDSKGGQPKQKKLANFFMAAPKTKS